MPQNPRDPEAQIGDLELASIGTAVMVLLAVLFFLFAIVCCIGGRINRLRRRFHKPLPPPTNYPRAEHVRGATVTDQIL